MQAAAAAALEAERLLIQQQLENELVTAHRRQLAAGRIYRYWKKYCYSPVHRKKINSIIKIQVLMGSRAFVCCMMQAALVLDALNQGHG